MSRLSQLLHTWKHNLIHLSSTTLQVSRKFPKFHFTNALRKSLSPVKPSTKIGLVLAGGVVAPFFLPFPPSTPQESTDKRESINWLQIPLLPFKPIYNAVHYPAVLAIIIASTIVSRGLRNVRLLPISNFLFCMSPTHLKMGMIAPFIGYVFAHVKMSHLALNMYLLCIFGPELIDKYGNVPFLITYFGGALVGSLVKVLSLLHYELMMNKIYGATTAMFSVISAYCWTKKEKVLGLPAWIWFPVPALIIEFLAVKSKKLSDPAWDLHLAGSLFGLTVGQCLVTPQKFQFNGQGQITLNSDGDTYDGQITNGIPTGKGKITSKFFPSYEGEVVNGVRNGSGKITYESCVYEGEMKNDKRHGKGILYNSLFKLTGTWKRDDLTRYSEIEIEHAIIKGNFKRGATNNYYGSGTFTLKNGLFVYEGEMKNMLFNGNGVSESNKLTTQIIKKGKFVEGRLHNGTIVYKFPDGKISEKIVKNYEVVEEKELAPAVLIEIVTQKEKEKEKEEETKVGVQQ